MDSFDPSAAIPLGLSEQACNECRRRKAKCDRTLPECSVCVKHRRHCLYEQHSRTPLTRKHLTEVEEKLRRAEIRARDAERRAASLLAEIGAHKSLKEQVLIPSWEASNGAASSVGNNPFDVGVKASQSEPAVSVLRVDNDVTVEHQDLNRSLEPRPAVAHDFSWDEQSPSAADRRADDSLPDEKPGEEEERRVADGMASLTVDAGDGGYLGGSSGAAMLRLLLPDAGTQKRRSTPSSTAVLPEPECPEVGSDGCIPSPLYKKLNIARIDVDTAIDVYFTTFHISYPIVHEPTFRAQYSQVIPRTSGPAWNALAYMIAAIGLWTMSSGVDSTDLDLFMTAKANLSVDSLETGNLTLVQVLTLMANYVQKRDKPNSGYNYLGLALHMSMGLGLHKSLQDWNLPPLTLEIRRRVWFCLFVFYTGAAITFGRPVVWPHREVPLPLNVTDRELTAASRRVPTESAYLTPYTAVVMQSKFHLVTNDIYARVIKNPYILPGELIHLDDTHIATWFKELPSWYAETVQLPQRYRFSHAIMFWRCSNFRIIMYRPFVIQRALSRGTEQNKPYTTKEQQACDRCLQEAQATIKSLQRFWLTEAHDRMSAWYVLYFIFQASLIPCFCLRNQPADPQADDWRSQIRSTLEVIASMKTLNAGGQDCLDVINQLVGGFMSVDTTLTPSAAVLDPTHESPQTQISNVYSMLWPNVGANEMDLMLQDDTWQDFIHTDL